jgi:CubicO group peptidase (beta-lactamase class C family)
MRLLTWSLLGVVALVTAGSMVTVRYPLAVARTAFAATTPSPVTGTASGALDRDDVEAFLDAALPRQMEEEHIAGAAVAVVRDGALLTSRGYGYADVEHKQSVDAEQTLFLTGSTGKLFTWTAVMQLVEQGKLDLDADVTTYLDFRIPATFPEPITLTHLMSHSAGFEDRPFIFAREPGELQPLGQYLADNTPARVRPPGVLSAYSNYGAALAGYVVERVARQPFADYVADRLFAPLRMRRSSFDQPLAPALRADLTASYAFENGAYQRVAPKYIRPSPAGASATTVTDMANFMIAHLDNGRVGDGRILADATAARMHGRLWSQDPRVSGFAYGFAESTVNGQRLLRHEGDVPGNGCSALLLLPEHRLGLYVAYNGMCDMTTGTQLWHGFLDRYYPAPAAPPPTSSPSTGTPADGAALAGAYRSTRRSFTSMSKVLPLFGGTLGDITVAVEPDGALRTEGLGPHPLRWVRADPGVFRPADDADTIYGNLVFRPGAGGVGRVLLVENTPYRAYERVAWPGAVGFNVGVLATCLVVFLSTLALLPLAALLRRVRDRPVLHPAAALRWARRLLTLAGALYLLFVVGLLVVATDAITYGVTPAVAVVFALPLAATALVPASLLFAAQGWRDRAWGGAIGRVQYGVVILAATAMAGWLHAWNLLGFRF